MVLKRFWKLITILIVIISILVTYFVHTSIVIANQFPELKINTISGDESILENVSISGEYFHSDNYSSSLMVSLDGSTYFGELSYFEKLEPNFPPNEVTKIKDKNRNFMRGKMNYPPSFFENDHYIAYVGAEISGWDVNYFAQYYLEVDVLNKETKKSHSFQTKLPGIKDVQYMGILDVQMVGEQLNVTVEINYQINERHLEEIKVYTMDISSEEIVGDQTLFDVTEQNNKDSWSNLTILSDFYGVGQGNYLLFQKDISTDGEVVQLDEYTEEVSFDLLERTFYVFDIEEKKLQELPLTEEERLELLSNDVRISGFTSDTNAYIAYINEDNLVVLSFNLVEMKVEQKQIFNMKDLGVQNLSLKMKDNKIYAVEYSDLGLKSAKLFVGDMLTGEVLYEGEIIVKNKKDEKGDFFLQFHTIIMD